MALAVGQHDAAVRGGFDAGVLEPRARCRVSLAQQLRKWQRDQTHKGNLLRQRRTHHLRGGAQRAAVCRRVQRVVVFLDVHVAHHGGQEGLQVAQLVLGRVIDSLDHAREFDIERDRIEIDELEHHVRAAPTLGRGVGLRSPDSGRGKCTPGLSLQRIEIRHRHIAPVLL